MNWFKKDKNEPKKSNPSENTNRVVTLYPQLILDALKNVRYPGSGKNLVEAEMIEDDIRIDGENVSFSINFPKPNDPFRKSVVKAAESAIHTYVAEEIVVSITAKTPQPVQEKVNPLPGVKNIIAVFSGKGGVGKSTITANLAVALRKQGYKVGVLDADIFGPSMPKMFHCEEARPVLDNSTGRDLIIPEEVMGIKLLSIGFFVDVDKALVWRGSMASNALKQLISDADWGELDYFLLDMPPGTSDIHLTLVQTLPITGAIVVSTPQQVALADAVKGIDLFRQDKVNVPILGLVENMAWFTPAELPENKYYIFGKDGAKELAEKENINLLGQIPLVQSICEAGDEGIPVAAKENTILSNAFADLAKKVVEVVADRNSNQAPTEIVKVTEH